MATRISAPIGRPPIDNYLGSYWEQNAQLIAKIRPSVPSFTKGLQIYKTDPSQGWIDYTRLLKEFGYTLDFSGEAGLSVVCSVEGLPTETFSSDFSESFLQQITGAVTPAIQELMFMTGAKTPDQAFTNLGKGIGGMSQTGLEWVGKQVKGVQDWGAQKGGALASTVTAIVGGGRVDFPHVWRSSGWAPSYSLNVRLMNPAGGSKKAHELFIVGPLCALLLLALPQSSKSHIYKWPFIHQLEIPGLATLKAAALTSISVTKGGDQVGIGLSQRPWLVDVRLDFASLHSVLLASKEIDIDSDLPTLGDYLNVLKGGKQIIRMMKNPPPPGTSMGSVAVSGPEKGRKYSRSSVSATSLTATLTSEDRVPNSDVRKAVLLLVDQPNDLKNEGEIRYLARLELDTRDHAKQIEGKENNPQYQDSLINYDETYQGALNSAESIEGTTIKLSSIEKPKVTSYNSPSYVEAQKWQGGPPTDPNRSSSEQLRAMQKRADDLSVKLAASTVSTTITDPQQQASAIMKKNIEDEYSPSYDFTEGIVSSGTRTGQELVATRTQIMLERIKLTNASKGET